MTPTTNDVEPTTSASDEVRHLLDERGVKWSSATSPRGGIWTYWDAFNGHRVYAMDNENGTVKIFGEWDVTPEQAIAATLGSFTVQATERTAKDSEKDSDGHGTCHDTHESRWFHCSECGFGLCDLYVDAPWHEYDQPKHCPNCGRKVVG